MSERPEWVPEDWLLYSRGYELGGEVPEDVRGAFEHSDPWIRVVAITLAAMSGDFSRVDDLVEVASSTDDLHLIDCALRVFAQAVSCAPPAFSCAVSSSWDARDFLVCITPPAGQLVDDGDCAGVTRSSTYLDPALRWVSVLGA